ncbi:MAG TPA: hypothetical protein VFO83_01375, partial [Aggregicoccus sp.]|nr:hypothetical protein [Aggregicoccus sp.]
MSRACIAAFNLGYKEALSEGAQPPAVFAVSLAVALPPMVLLRQRAEQGWAQLGRKLCARLERRQLLGVALVVLGAALLGLPRLIPFRRVAKGTTDGA